MKEDMKNAIPRVEKELIRICGFDNGFSGEITEAKALEKCQIPLTRSGGQYILSVLEYVRKNGMRYQPPTLIDKLADWNPYTSRNTIIREVYGTIKASSKLASISGFDGLTLEYLVFMLSNIMEYGDSMNEVHKEQLQVNGQLSKLNLRNRVLKLISELDPGNNFSIHDLWLKLSSDGHSKENMATITNYVAIACKDGLIRRTGRGAYTRS